MSDEFRTPPYVDISPEATMPEPVTDLENDEVRSVRCATCGAKRGEPCVTTGKLGMRLTHRARQRTFARRTLRNAGISLSPGP
jgi:hypothetical protein